MRYIKRLSILIAGLSCCALLLSSLTQVSYSGPPMAAATLPDGKITLPGEIKLKRGDLVPMHPEVKPIATVPFTVKELQTLLGTHVKMVGGEPYITGKTNHQIRLAQYVDELNLVEHYLNRLGYTLRDGSLAVGHPPNAKVLRPDLGSILRLRDPIKLSDPIPGSGQPATRTVGDKATKPPLRDYTIVEDPLAVVSNPNVLVELGDATIYIPRTRNNAQPGIEYQVPRTDILAAKDMHVKRLLLPGWGVGNAARALDVPMPCDSTPDQGCACVGENAYCHNGKFVGNWGGDCSVGLNPIGPPPDSGPPTNVTITTPGNSCGDKVPDDPPCLYDPKGSMHAKWAAIASCVDSTSAREWFDAAICSEMTFRGDQNVANLVLNNSGQTHFDIKLFGKVFNLLNAHAYSQYDGQPSNGTDGTIPTLGLTLPPEGFSGNYDMPQVTIPLIEPLNLTITGGGALSMGFDKNSAPFVEPSHICGPTTKGSLGLNLGSHAYADLHLTAAIDALVLSAGIKGVLVLADDKVGLDMTDDINPSGNEVVVSPDFSYHIRHMAGHIYVVVTVDVIIYSKTFEVELFNFDGYHPEDKTVKVPPHTYSSKQESGSGPVGQLRRARSGS